MAGRFASVPGNQYLFLLAGGFTLLRLLTASLIDLGNDEVYYFTYAIQPDWNHFDHPPLVGIFIRLFTLNMHFDQELFVRLPAIAGAFLNTFLIATCSRLIFGKKAGLRAAFIYNICIYTSIISGAMILPDSVQLSFWLLAMLSIVKADERKNAGEVGRYLLAFGLWTGLATMSKVHGVFLWAGVLSFALFQKREWFRMPAFYLAFGVTAFLVSPILFWNVNNDFITWKFHSERVEARNGLDIKSFLTTTIGQITYFNPLLMALAAAALFYFMSKWKIKGNGKISLVLWLSLPILLCTTAVSFLRPTLPHWGGPGFIGLIILTAGYLEMQPQRWHKITLNIALALTLIVFIAGLAVVKMYPGTMGKNEGPELGKYDMTLDLDGWKELLPSFAKVRQSDIQNSLMPASAPIVVHKWFPGAHVFYYLAYPLDIPVRGIGKLGDLHQFQWMNARSSPIPEGGSAYYITPSNYFTEPSGEFGEKFKTYEKAASVPQYRNGKLARYWYIFRLRGYAGSPGAQAPE